METMVIRGKRIDDNTLAQIKLAIKKGWAKGRTYISRELCAAWDWRQHNGELKDQICRILLNHLEREKLIILPPRKGGTTKGKKRYYIAPTEPPHFPRTPLEGKLKDFAPIELKMVRRSPDEEVWNYLIHRYHYKSYKIIVGAHLKYIAYLEERPIACLAWSSSIFRIQCRDQFLGWTQEQRSRNIRYVANNSRYLILPWVQIKNLASHLLSLSAKAVRRDWRQFYGHPVYLLETFVEKDRFRGTCYKAANWQCVGETKGHAKRNKTFYYHGRKKDVYLYPLVPDFRKQLGGSQ